MVLHGYQYYLGVGEGLIHGNVLTSMLDIVRDRFLQNYHKFKKFCFYIVSMITSILLVLFRVGMTLTLD